jgi:HD-like signal output (HDOD) protein
MSGWLDRLLGRDKSPNAADGQSARPATAQVEPPAEFEAPALSKLPDVLSRESLLAALSLEAPATAPLAADPELVTRVRSLFQQTNPVPGSPPQLAMRILNIVSQADADPAELAKLISHDSSLTAAVLRVANSAAFRAVGRIETVRDAITRIGMREVARVGCALSAKSVFDPQRRSEQALFGPVFLDLFIHASSSALASSALAMTLPKLKTKSDTVFVSGLLHDLGKSVALRLLATIMSAEPGRRALTPDEAHAILEALHIEFGAHLHTEWRLPESSLSICQHHHDGLIPEGVALVDENHVVRLVSAMHLLHARPVTDARLLEVEGSARALGLNPKQLRDFDAQLTGFREMAHELGS